MITRIENYVDSWEITVKERQAIYYYNYALYVKEQANVHSAIKYLQLSLKNYKFMPESEQDQTIIKQLIKEIQQKESKLSQHPSNSNTQKRKVFPADTHLEPASKKHKSEPTIKIDYSVSYAHEEQATQIWAEKIKRSLNEISIDNNVYLRYAKLFFIIASQLTRHTKESDNHYLLTKLSWLSIAENLTALSPVKNSQLSEEITQQICRLTQQHHRILNQISTQKRATAYPTYPESYLATQNLCDLLSNEILDYHYGLEAFQLHKQGTHLLSAIHELVEKESNGLSAIANTMQQTKSSIQSIDQNAKNLFSAKLLRELFKFYTCQENQEWLEANSHFKGNETLFYNEYNKLLTAALEFAKKTGPEGKELITKLHHSIEYLSQIQAKALRPLPCSSFFQTHTTPDLETLLEKHLKFIVEFRKFSITPEVPCKSFLKFIQQQCREQVEAQKSMPIALSQ